MIDFDLVKREDIEIYNAMEKELGRQQGNLELIASENFVSQAVMQAMGSFLTNKYAEGYPGKRYYGGCEYVDIVEDLARDRAKRLFGAEHANVQPHSGAQANMAVFFAALEPGDTVLSMSLSHGGHLSHGSPVNISGKYFNIVPYGVREDDEQIDYDALYNLAIDTKPKMIIAGASAYPRTLDFNKFREIADAVGAYLMADIAHIAGLIVAGEHPSSIPYAHFTTTTTHKTLRGPRGGMILCSEEFAKMIDKAVFPGIQGGPLMHIIAAKAVSFKEALADDFKAYQKQVVKNAKVLSERLVKNGLRLASGGTDNHLMLLDVGAKGQTGKDVEKLLDRAGITVNKNTIPFETLSPFVTSGIRLGTPAVTTRGMGEAEMEKIADMIANMIEQGEGAIDATKAQVARLCEAYPLYA